MNPGWCIVGAEVYDVNLNLLACVPSFMHLLFHYKLTSVKNASHVDQV